MDRKLVLSILGVALLAFLGILLLPPPARDDGQVRLPWQAGRDDAGRTQAFGFTLGQTTLAEARAVFGEEGKLSLFEAPDAHDGERYGVEAYFEQIHLQRLRADFVLTLDLDQPTLAAMYERGLRISQTGGGSRRIALAPEDAAALAGRPLRAIAYLPRTRLDAALLERRFGIPAERRLEPDGGVEHWLYPERGIDLGRAPDGRVVIQYANAGDFARLRRPLESMRPEPAPALKPIRFVTDWKAQAPHGGFYQASATGIYARHGLDARIIQGGPAVNVPLLLGAGEADFAIGSNSFIALNLVAAGIPATAVAAIFQKDPQVLITHPRDDIRTLADLRGQPILISDAAAGSYWLWLKARFGFEDRQIRKYTYNLAPFLADPRAIQQGYVTSEPYQIEQASGVRPQVFLLADADYPAYANLILASHRRIREDPDSVRAFVAASIEGWRDYLTGDPAPGNARIRADNPEMTDDLLRHAIASMNEHRLATDDAAATDGIGAMTERRWHDFFQVMADAGVYPPDLDWRAAWTGDYLPAAPRP